MLCGYWCSVFFVVNCFSLVCGVVFWFVGFFGYLYLRLFSEKWIFFRIFRFFVRGVGLLLNSCNSFLVGFRCCLVFCCSWWLVVFRCLCSWI